MAQGDPANTNRTRLTCVSAWLFPVGGGDSRRRYLSYLGDIVRACALTILTSSVQPPVLNGSSEEMSSSDKKNKEIYSAQPHWG